MHASPCRAFLLTLGLAAWGGACAQEAPPTVCLDPKPSSRSQAAREAGAPAPSFSQELFERLFRQIGRPARFITDQPWARCLQAVSRGQIDFALGGYHSTERARVFDFSIAYQSLTPSIFSAARRPLRPQQPGDLQGLTGCGMIGASYAHYGLPAGALDTGVSSFPRLFDKLARGRCDYIPEELEVVVGIKLNELDVLATPAIVVAPAPWAKAPTKHLLAAKGSAAASLLPAVDRVLQKAIQDGSAAELWRRHVPDSPYRP